MNKRQRKKAQQKFLGLSSGRLRRWKRTKEERVMYFMRCLSMVGIRANELAKSMREFGRRLNLLRQPLREGMSSIKAGGSYE